MHKTTLEQWRMFLAVAQHGGFNQAAQAIHKSQSSIHHAVKKLEEQLGVILFEIEGRKALLSEHGELLKRRGRFLIEEVERIESVAQTLSGGVEAGLSIAVDEAFPPYILYEVMELVSGLFPQLKLDIIETVLSGSNELIQSGKACLGISPIPMPQGLNEDLCEIEFLAVSSPDHPLQHHVTFQGDTLSTEALKPYRQIVVRDSALHTQVDQGWLGSEQRWTVSHVRSSIDLVSKGLGFAWLPKAVIQDKLDKGELIPLPLERGSTRQAIMHLNYRDADALGPAAREFMAQLRLKFMD